MYAALLQLMTTIITINKTDISYRHTTAKDRNNEFKPALSADNTSV